MSVNKQLLEEVFNFFEAKKTFYDEIFHYYKGHSRALEDYFIIEEPHRSNHKIRVNFIKKFIKEETSYSVGNDITYVSKKGDANVIKDIDYYLEHWSEQHDSLLMNRMLTYGFAFELYYIDDNAQFCSQIITPREGYAYTDEYGNVLFFMHVYYKKFDTELYIDVYDKNNIDHYVGGLGNLVNTEEHFFQGEVPVAIAKISDEREHDTIFNDIRGLQDAYETNLSDISNEISDFRNAYLSVFGFQLEDALELKEKGIIQVSTDKGRVEWVMININMRCI